jgi:hypothetical protein
VHTLGLGEPVDVGNPVFEVGLGSTIGILSALMPSGSVVQCAGHA